MARVSYKIVQQRLLGHCHTRSTPGYTTGIVGSKSVETRVVEISTDNIHPYTLFIVILLFEKERFWMHLIYHFCSCTLFCTPTIHTLVAFYCCTVPLTGNLMNECE